MLIIYTSLVLLHPSSYAQTLILILTADLGNFHSFYFLVEWKHTIQLSSSPMKAYTFVFTMSHQICHGRTYVHGFLRIRRNSTRCINCFCKTGHTSIAFVASGVINSPRFLGGVVTYTTLIKGLISQDTAVRVFTWGK